MSAARLSTVFQSNRLSLIGTVFRIVKDRQTAEDLTQETYLRASKAIALRPVEHLEAYLHQTARNLALDHVRQRKARDRWEQRGIERDLLESIPAGQQTVEAHLIEQEQLRLLDAALQELPVRVRQVWALTRQGWTYAAIADHLGISRNTVYNDFKHAMGHCHDALARLYRG